ncbi:hypothetical protein [Zunongwangia atlantica]|uniref:GIY-YIG domain-containing protein n=1 Tax=Zunongwangia atlantica 22II14-10F7 TaxID=1185767 RepID=A0A1Y1SXM8_9FLAO|nr:hypothetical protein [Zunongwangia atlantica]ORL43521.1 hypothetical protein IIF7_20409 [Zunongwangia atlantica 22II14-10F7]
MAVTIDELFNEFDLDYEGPFKWYDNLNANYNGVYIIATTNKPKSKTPTNSFNICPKTFEFWIKEAEDLNIKGEKVKEITQVSDYLENFWNPNENILYIGASSSKTNPLQKRIQQFFDHKVGFQGPHTGGYWLKLLDCLENTYVYYSKCKNPTQIEFKMLLKFVDKSSGNSFYDLEDFTNYFPFANLKIDVLKKHQIKNYTNKKKKSKKRKVTTVNRQ